MLPPAVRLLSFLATSLVVFASAAEAQPASAVDCLGCVDRNDLATGAVTAPKLGLGAVTTQKIKNGAVTLEKLAPEVQARLAPPRASELYQPTSVIVNCTGEGTPLTEAIAALNPAAAVYDVQISGACNENLELRNFQSITLRSADPASPATIGRVRSWPGNTYVGISAIRVQTFGVGVETSLGTPVLAHYATGRLELQGVEFVCAPPAGVSSCEDVVVINSGDGRLVGVTFIGPWATDSGGRKGDISINRGGNALVYATTGSDSASCTGIRSVSVQNMSTANVEGECSGEIGVLRSGSGSTIVYSGGTADVLAYQGRVLGSSSGGNGAWLRSVSCDGVLSAVVDQFGGNTNYCAP